MLIFTLETEILSHRIQYFRGKDLWLSIDGSSDHRRGLTGIVLGVMDSSMNSLPITVKPSIGKTGEKIFDEILDTLKKYEINPNQLKVLVTDSERAVRKAGKLVKSRFPHVVHVFCIPHQFNIVASVLQKSLPLLNTFIGRLKQIVSKSSQRRSMFKLLTGLKQFMPIPHNIRWGTWIKTVNYLYWHFDAVIHFLVQLPEDKKPKSTSENSDCEGDFTRLLQLKNDIQNESYKNNLRKSIDFVFKFYSNLPCLITMAEKSQTEISKVNSYVDMFKAMLNIASQQAPPEFKQIANNLVSKFENCLKDNTGFYQLVEYIKIDPASLYRFSPATSAGTERLFGAYRIYFGDKRQQNYGNDKLEMATAGKVAIRANKFKVS